MPIYKNAVDNELKEEGRRGEEREKRGMKHQQTGKRQKNKKQIRFVTRNIQRQLFLPQEKLSKNVPELN